MNGSVATTRKDSVATIRDSLPGLHRGLSPRAGLLLMAAARAWALLAGRPMVLPEDVQAVTQWLQREQQRLQAYTRSQMQHLHNEHQALVQQSYLSEQAVISRSQELSRCQPCVSEAVDDFEGGLLVSTATTTTICRIPHGRSILGGSSPSSNARWDSPAITDEVSG